MISEGDLACAMDQSNKIREMQDKISNLRAQVLIFIEFIYNLRGRNNFSAIFR